MTGPHRIALGKTAVCSFVLAVWLGLPQVVDVGIAGGAGDTAATEDNQAESAVALDKNPFTGDAAAIEEGRKLWRRTGCYSCHGGQAEGGVGPDLTDDDWVYRPTDKTLFNTIANGRSGTVMVSWSKELNPTEIWKVIAYIRSLYEGDPNKIIW